jgi:hypothetical protein
LVQHASLRELIGSSEKKFSGRAGRQLPLNLCSLVAGASVFCAFAAAASARVHRETEVLRRRLSRGLELYYDIVTVTFRKLRLAHECIAFFLAFGKGVRRLSAMGQR